MTRILGMTLGWFIVTVAVIMGLAIGGVYFTAFYSKTTANTRGNTQQREANQGNGAFRQATYEEFFNLCQSVQADEAKVDNLKTESAQSTDAFRKEQIAMSITAVKNSRAEAITQYNAKAAEKHRSQFLDSDLPYRLELTNMETECAA